MEPDRTIIKKLTPPKDPRGRPPRDPRQGVFQRISQELAEDLYKRGQINIREAFIDGSFASARQSAAKAPRLWPSQTLLVFLSSHEVKSVDATIDSAFTRYAPDKLIGDKAYDSDGLDQRLFEERNVQMIALHRKGRKKPKTQDGRKLRPYRRRWKVKRLFA